MNKHCMRLRVSQQSAHDKGSALTSDSLVAMEGTELISGPRLQHV